jgi:TrmH family RNA methyltransferase
MKLRVVLVEPREGGNVGAAARAMKNFGFTELAIVGERDLRHDPSAGWWSSGADDVVAAALHFRTVEEALRDCHLAVATTAVRGRHVYEQLTPGTVAELAHSSLAAEERLALVFGREESGLSGRDIAACQRTAVIPTWPGFPTMNLAQSVAIFCYELGKRDRPAARETPAAPVELIQELQAHLRQLLEEIGYFKDKKRDHLWAEIAAFSGRSMLNVREASLLLAIIRKIENKLGKSEE